MPKGKPESGKRTIDPANRPGPKPVDRPVMRRRSVYCSEQELKQIREYLRELRGKTEE